MPALLENDATPVIDGVPNWVPTGAQHYIAHIEQGQPIRALARAAGCHASTILRQIRKVELLRDDPLVDAALRKLSAGHSVRALPKSSRTSRATPTTSPKEEMIPDTDTLGREAMRVLRRLCEAGAVLAVAAEMENAVVVREMPDGGSTRTAVVASDVAQALALKNWIASANQGRIIRYMITPAGRAALSDMIKRLKGGGGGGEALGDMPPDGWQDDLDDASIVTDTRSRFSMGESPLITLARRRDKDGTRFLKDELVHAGEQLREDFELAQMDSRTTQNWDSFLTAGAQQSIRTADSGTNASAEARARVGAALHQLGPGLSDVALRCCCYLEGLETTEKRLGWSARSGKIVLRIALMRLKRHYDETVGPGGPLIG